MPKKILTPEQRERKNERQRNLTPEQRERQREWKREWKRNLTPEQRERGNKASRNCMQKMAAAAKRAAFQSISRAVKGTP